MTNAFEIYLSKLDQAFSQGVRDFSEITFGFPDLISIENHEELFLVLSAFIKARVGAFPSSHKFDEEYLKVLEPWFFFIVPNVLEKLFMEKIQNIPRKFLTDDVGVLLLRNPNISQEYLKLFESYKSSTVDSYFLMTVTSFFEDLCLLRISEVFEMIRSYPHSSIALQELQDLIKRCSFETTLVNQVQKDMKRRLLHAGVSTQDILNMFVLMVQAFKVLDPPGFLFPMASVDIRHYLRSRSDAVTIAVRCCINNPNHPLARELASLNAKTVDEALSCLDSESDESWMPAPRHAPVEMAHSRKGVDTLAQVVAIFQNKEIFIKAYQQELAAGLLKGGSRTIAKYAKTLKLMKSRFASSSLSACGVMISDMISSHSLNERIKKEANKLEIEDSSSPIEERPTFPLSAMDTTVISRCYWPIVNIEDDDEEEEEAGTSEKFHSSFADTLAVCEREFESMKPKQTLVWLPSIGEVELDIVLDNGTTSKVKCTPRQANILAFFQDQPQWDSEELSEAMGIDEELLNLEILFWISKDLISVQDMGLEKLYTLNEE